ncbi:M56 family metallopeptidase, partial [Persicitalea sp.]|uniref:M56 family metallopeptidase n=1 Tax=Persicitalea sp. TaxID=3100273 RepID=UPI0035945FCD
MNIITYLLQTNLYWLLLYGCYWLLLRRQTFFVWNRAYLLGALLLSFGLPLLQYPAAAPPVPAAVYELTSLPLESATIAVAEAVPAAFVVTPQADATAAPFPWLDLLLVLYIVGAVFMLVRLLWQFRRLFSFFQKGERITLDDYQIILLKDEAPGSFSFLNWLVVNRLDYENDFDTVLRHELVHVRQRHSVDIVLVEILRVVFWFNPVLILYKKSLQQVHEYLADAAAPQRDRYADFLLAYAQHNPANALTNNFLNSSNLKKRIKMLYKNRNSKWALSKYFAVAPLIGLVLMLTAARERVADVVDSSKPLVSATAWVAELPEALPIETTTVKGTVRSSKTKELLPGANVILAGTS